MKSSLWVLLLVGVLGATVALAQSAPPPAERPPVSPAEQMQQMDMHLRGLEVRERESKLEFERAMESMQLEQRRMELDRQKQAGAAPGWGPQPGPWRGHHCHGAGALLMLCAVLHALLATWVYQDNRRRNAGSGIWIVITLLAGLFGAAVYALVRLGDRPEVPAR